MKKRALSIFLLTAMLAACGETAPVADDTTTDSTAAQTTAEPSGPSLPDKTYDGQTFTIYCRSARPDTVETDFLLEAPTGDVLDDAIYNRMLTVSDKLGVTFETVSKSDDPDGRNAKNTILAGEDAYQLVVSHARVSFSYGQDDLAYDWNNLPWVDFTNEWWDENAVSSLSVGNKTFVVMDDLTYNNLSETKALLFCKDIFDKYNLDYPYEMVRNGTWTFDKMVELCEQVSDDINGDSAMKITDDRYGYMTDWYGSPANILTTAGQRIAVVNDEGNMELTLNSPRTVEVFETFFAFLDSEAAFLNNSNDNTNTNAAFRDGRIAFQEARLADVPGLRDMNAEFGILPPPKFDDTVEDYYTAVDAGCNALIVPVTISDPEFVSAVIEAICYENHTQVMPVYYETVLKTKSSRDDESAEMIDIIRAGRTFDIGYFMLGFYPEGAKFADIGHYLSKTTGHPFASFYAENESSVLGCIDEINEQYN